MELWSGVCFGGCILTKQKLWQQALWGGTHSQATARIKDYKYTMHYIFDNFLCFTSYFAHLGAVSNNFNDSGQKRILCN